MSEPQLEQPLYIGGHIPIDAAIQMHLVDCDRCRYAYERQTPRRLGQKTGLCDEYLHLQLLKAEYEGKINNVVAHTEYGDEAKIMGQLD